MRLAIFVGIVSLLCVSGLVVAYHLYDNATKPDRSAPDVVVDNYLRAFLVHRDDDEASQYTCADQSGLADFKKFLLDIELREKILSVATSFTWKTTNVIGVGSKAFVEVRLTVDTSAASSVGITAESIHDWRFQTVRAIDWRVCGSTAFS